MFNTDDTDHNAIQRFRMLELDDAAPATTPTHGPNVTCPVWVARHILRSTGSCRCGWRPAAAPAVNPEPEAKVRPIELEPAPIEQARAAAGVKLNGAGRGTSNARMGRDAKADQYCTSSKGIGSAAAARRLFGLDWTVSLAPLTATLKDGRVIPVPGDRAVIRDDTGEVLATVGSKYVPMQNTTLDLLDYIRDDAPIVRGGVWDGGRRVWLQVDLGKIETPSGAAEGTALAATSHDASLAFTLTVGGVVVVCRNTFRRNLKGAPNAISIRHTASSVDAAERMRDALTMGRENLKAMQAEMLSWGRKKIGDADLTRFVDTYLPKPAEETKRAVASRKERVDAWMTGYRTAPGAMPGTAWGLAQATTYYADHIRAVRAGTDRLERAWTDGGTERALQHVAVIAGTA